MKKHVLAAALILAALVGATRANPPTASAAAPASQAAAPDQAHWQATIKQLGADDFATRDAAQKDLDQMTWRQLDVLRQAAADAGDPEVKARLTARVAAIEEDLAINPPPITLEFKDATTADVADALSKALGIKLDVWPPHNMGENSLFTLSAREKPFWEVFMQLSRQHGLSLQDMGNRAALTTQGGQGWSHGVVVGPVAIFPQSITRQRTANLQADKGQELGAESMSVSCQVIIDPRVRLVKYATPVFTAIVDDAGNTLFQLPPREGNLWDFNGHMTIQGLNASLKMPEKKGTRVVSAKGSVRFVAQVAEEHAELDDVEKKIGQSVAIAGTSVRVVRFTVQGNADNASINMSLDSSGGPAAGGIRLLPRNGPDTTPSIVVTLLDSAGKTAFTSTFRGGSMGAGIGGSFTGPYKLRLSLATKTKDVTLPFELKDLPLP